MGRCNRQGFGKNNSNLERTFVLLELGQEQQLLHLVLTTLLRCSLGTKHQWRQAHINIAAEAVWTVVGVQSFDVKEYHSQPPMQASDTSPEGHQFRRSSFYSRN